MWITVSEASKLCKCPERTLRHYAVKGQIRTGKKGKKWLLQIGDLIKKGLITEAEIHQFKMRNSNNQLKGNTIIERSEVIEMNIAIPTHSTNPENEAAIKMATSEASDEKPGTPSKFQRYKRVDQIGVFSELLNVFLTNKMDLNIQHPSTTLIKPVGEQIVTSLKFISMGFFENTPALKSQHFREAKNILARTVIDLKLTAPLTSDLQKPDIDRNHQIEIQFQESIIPGLIGLINRAEKRSFHRNDLSARKNN